MLSHVKPGLHLSSVEGSSSRVPSVVETDKEGCKTHLEEKNLQPELTEKDNGGAIYNHLLDCNSVIDQPTTANEDVATIPIRRQDTDLSFEPTKQENSTTIDTHIIDCNLAMEIREDKEAHPQPADKSDVEAVHRNTVNCNSQDRQRVTTA